MDARDRLRRIYGFKNSRLKLIILTQYFYPEMGAPQNRLYELAMELRLLGWEVDIVTAMPNYPTGKIFQSHRGKLYLKENISGMTIHRYCMYPSNSSRVLPRILSMLSFSITSFFSWYTVRKAKPDYLLVESPPLTLAFTGWVISKLAHTSLIMNVSDLWPLSAKELGAISDGFIYKRLIALESFLYRKATICTGQSQEIVDYIEDATPNKPYLFRNGVDTARFMNTNFDSTRRNHIVYAGLLGVAQGILSICQNIDFKELNTEFHIYGTGTELNKILDFLKKNPLRGITYHGILNRDKIPEVLGLYGCTMIPLIKNIYGAVPSKIYEAMAAGLPIIFSGAGEGAVIIKNTKAGWVSSPMNWNALKLSIMEFLNLTDAEYLIIRERNRQTASQNFDRKIQIFEFNKFLKGLNF